MWPTVGCTLGAEALEPLLSGLLAAGDSVRIGDGAVEGSIGRAAEGTVVLLLLDALPLAWSSFSTSFRLSLILPDF